MAGFSQWYSCRTVNPNTALSAQREWLRHFSRGREESRWLRCSPRVWAIYRYLVDVEIVRMCVNSKSKFQPHSSQKECPEHLVKWRSQSLPYFCSILKFDIWVLRAPKHPKKLLIHSFVTSPRTSAILCGRVDKWKKRVRLRPFCSWLLRRWSAVQDLEVR